MATTRSDGMSDAKRAHVRATLRKEFTAFFTTMTSPTPQGWPAISNQELIDALADSLIALGNQRQLGTALLQTLVLELQDRVNQQLTPEK